MKSKAAAWIVLGLVTGWAAIAANVYVVPPDTPGASPTPPYTSWATAATNIADAIAAINPTDGNIVFISNGTYMLPDQIVVNKGVVLRSWKDGQTDRDGAILDGNNYPGKPVTNRVITLDHPDAVLDGLTIQGGGPIQASGASARDARGAGVFIYRFAMITNCLIANNIPAVLTNGNSQGGGVYVDAYYTSYNGVITHTTIVSNQAAEGGGIYAYPQGGFLVEHCQILANESVRPDSYRGGGGVHIGSRSLDKVATFRNCLIAHNKANQEGAGVGIWYAGMFENCQVVSNDASPGGVAAGVYIRNGDSNSYAGVPHLRNCLIQGNSVGTGTRAAVGIELTERNKVAALIENCTIVDNTTAWGWRRRDMSANTTAIHFVNTLIYGHADNVINLANTYFTNCLSTVALPGENNITNVAPTFADGYRLAGGSAGVNDGLNQAWMTESGVTDLDGHTRIDRFSGKVDMGCYEYLPRGTAFTLH